MKFNQFNTGFRLGLFHLKHCLQMKKSQKLTKLKTNYSNIPFQDSHFYKLVLAWKNWSYWSMRLCRMRQKGLGFSISDRQGSNCLLFPGYTMPASRINKRKYFKKKLLKTNSRVICQSYKLYLKKFKWDREAESWGRWMETTPPPQAGWFPSQLPVIG